jgi:hypothetical protein
MASWWIKKVNEIKSLFRREGLYNLIRNEYWWRIKTKQYFTNFSVEVNFHYVREWEKIARENIIKVIEGNIIINWSWGEDWINKIKAWRKIIKVKGTGIVKAKRYLNE